MKDATLEEQIVYLRRTSRELLARMDLCESRHRFLYPDMSDIAIHENLYRDIQKFLSSLARRTSREEEL